VNGIDFGLYDMRTEVITPNAATYRERRYWTYLHAVCPYDYFAEALKPSYFERFGSVTGARVPAAPCRQHSDQYAAGTIAGEWFLQSHAPDGTYQAQMAVGTTLDGGTVRIAGIGGTHDAAGGPDPKTVTADACYASGGNFIALRMTSATTLEAVRGSGVCPGTFPAGAERGYRR
jgi:hypothetical protein